MRVKLTKKQIATLGAGVRAGSPVRLQFSAKQLRTEGPHEVALSGAQRAAVSRARAVGSGVALAFSPAQLRGGWVANALMTVGKFVLPEIMAGLGGAAGDLIARHISGTGVTALPLPGQAPPTRPGPFPDVRGEIPVVGALDVPGARHVRAPPLPKLVGAPPPIGRVVRRWEMR